MSYEMYLPLAICVVGFYLLFVYILLLRLRVEILYRERDTSWVKDYLNQRIG
jgi:heme exporter protein C